MATWFPREMGATSRSSRGTLARSARSVRSYSSALIASNLVGFSSAASRPSTLANGMAGSPRAPRRSARPARGSCRRGRRPTPGASCGASWSTPRWRSPLPVSTRRYPPCWTTSLVCASAAPRRRRRIALPPPRRPYWSRSASLTRTPSRRVRKWRRARTRRYARCGKRCARRSSSGWASGAISRSGAARPKWTAKSASS